MQTIVLVVRLAYFALQTRPDLSSHSDAVSDFAERDFRTRFDDFADDFVADAERELSLAPAAGDSVEIACAGEE